MKENQSDAGKEFGNGKSTFSPNGEQSKNRIYTDKELAKLSEVGNETVASFNRHYAISAWKYYNITWSY